MGFHALRGGIDPGDLRFHPRVGVVEIWQDFLPVDGILSLPGAAGPRRWPEGQLSPRAGSTLYEPQPISIDPVGLGFPHPSGLYRPGGSAVRPRVVGVVEIWKDF